MIFSGGLYLVMQKKERKKNAQAYFAYEQVTNYIIDFLITHHDNS
jgi:hypothetical protein